MFSLWSEWKHTMSLNEKQFNFSHFLNATSNNARMDLNGKSVCPCRFRHIPHRNQFHHIRKMPFLTSATIFSKVNTLKICQWMFQNAKQMKRNKKWCLSSLARFVLFVQLWFEIWNRTQRPKFFVVDSNEKPNMKVKGFQYSRKKANDNNGKLPKE